MDGISSVRLDGYTSSVQSAAFTQQHRRPPGMDAAAKLLGMSDSDLRSAMQSGQSLADVAASKGIGKDQLVSTIAAAIQQSNTSMSADRATAIATDIATRTPGKVGGAGEPGGLDGPRGASGTGGSGDASETVTDSSADDATSTTSVGGSHHRHHRHHAMATAMQAASQALGMSTTDLTTALKNGQSVSSLASSKGIKQDDLVKAVSDALQGADSNLSADQATDLATGLVTATPQAPSWATGNPGSTSTFGILA